MKRILVLGGRRFVGNELVRNLLEEGNDVTVANRSGMSAFEDAVHNIVFDRNDRESIKNKISRSNWDVVYDMICYSSQNAKDIVENISTGKYIMISSSVVYDWGINHKEEEFNAYNYAAINDTFEVLGKKFGFKQRYKLGKMGAESVIMRNNKDISPVCVRFPLIVGEGDHTKRMETYIEAIRNGKGIFVDNLYSNVAMVQAKNAAKYLAQIKDRRFNGAINFSDLGNIFILDLVDKIANIMNQNVTYDSDGIKGGYNEYFSNTLNLEKMIGIGITPENLNMEVLLKELILQF